MAGIVGGTTVCNPYTPSLANVTSITAHPVVLLPLYCNIEKVPLVYFLTAQERRRHPPLTSRIGHDGIFICLRRVEYAESDPRADNQQSPTIHSAGGGKGIA